MKTTSVTLTYSPPHTLPHPHYLLYKQAVGVLGPGAALIAFGVLMWLSYTFAYCCGCIRCCGSRNCVKSRKANIADRPWLGAPAGVLIFAILNLGLVISAIAYLPGFVTAVSSVETSLAGFSKTLKAGSQLMTASGAPFTFTKLDGSVETVTSLASSISLAATYASTLVTTTNAMTYNDSTTTYYVSQEFPELPTYLNAAESALNSASSYVTEASAPINTAGTTLTDSIGSIPFNAAKQYIFLGGVIVLGIIIGLITIQSIMVCRNRFACCMFKTLAFISVTLSSLIFVLAGIFYIIGTFGSDVCYDPYAVIKSLLGSTTGDVATESLSFYLTCSASTPTSGTFLDMLSSSLLSITTAAEQQVLSSSATEGIVDAIPALESSFDSTSSFGIANAAIITSLVAGSRAVSLIITDLLSCIAVGNLIDPLITGLCTGITSSIGISRILIAAGTLLFIQLAFGVEVCCHHPGDENAWAVDDKQMPAGITTRSPNNINIGINNAGAPKSVPISMV